MIRSFHVGVCAALFVIAACSRSSDRPAEPNGVNDAYVEPRNDGEMRPASRARGAAESITEARCAREQRCENIGSDKKYSSFSDCSARISNDWKEELNARECPGGIDQKELDECLAAIRNEDCNSPFDTLGRLTECTAGPICRDDNDRPDDNDR
jgi:hypothetical protein